MKITTITCDNCGEEIRSNGRGYPHFSLLFGAICHITLQSAYIKDICKPCRIIVSQTLADQMKMIDRQSLAYKQTLALQLKGKPDPK